MGDSDKNDVDLLMSTVAIKAPITAKHRIRTDLDLFIPKPYMPRALVCPDAEHPLGTQGINHHDMTVLQRHVAYFDRNNDGIIYPWETYQGLRGLGFGQIFCFVSCIFTNIGFSYPTLPGWIPSPLFPIYIKNIHRSQHASVSCTYDPEGRFIPANFENLFSKYARTVPDKFTLRELWNLTEGHRNVHDPVGSVGNKLEWYFLYLVGKDEDGYVHKDVVRRLFDGTLFYYIERKRHDHRQ